MALYPDYTTLARLRSFLRVTDAADTTDDTWFSLAITAASRAVDKATNRQFGVEATTAARVYTAIFDERTGRYYIPVDDFQTTTGLVIKTDPLRDGVYSETVTAAVTPLPRLPNGRPWTSISLGTTGVQPYGHEGGVEITAKWGWTSVPSAIEQATLLQASRIVKRRDAPFGIAGSSDLGSEMRLFARLDPDVEVLINTYRRWWAAA